MNLLTDAYIVTGKEKILRKRKIVHYNGPSTITNNKLILLCFALFSFVLCTLCCQFLWIGHF
jgi:hypothetical protein